MCSSPDGLLMWPVVIRPRRLATTFGCDPAVHGSRGRHLPRRARRAFEGLVRDRLGDPATAHTLWSAPRLICVVGDFTR